MRIEYGRGEKIIHGIHVDGYCEETKTVFEFHGCFFHGCEVCFNRDDINPVSKIPMWALLKKTKERAAKIRSSGFNLKEMWEHDFLRMKRNDISLKEFRSQLEIVERMNPRDAFYVGRTTATRLSYDGEAKYIDFTSLYPYVNKYCLYPTGHPEIITSNFGDISEYFGIVKCSILPPRGLYHPVLPFRSKGKLTFPLCSSCVETRCSKCEHEDSARVLRGTWVTVEVDKAVEVGYRIEKIYKVHHFKERTTSLFETYIYSFLKTKQETSGWPEKCQTLEEKSEYVRNYEEHERIFLNQDNIEKIPGKRQVSKLCLNSFWGRWGMKENKMQTSFVSSLPAFNDLTDTMKEVCDNYFPNESLAALKWKMKEEFWKLGEAVLYYDTDSIIYASNGINDPEIGDFLGDFTDELEGDVIVKFVSGGAKNYAYVTKSGKSVCKIRGFSLNYENSLKLNFDSVLKLLRSFDDERITVTNPRKITRDVKAVKIINKVEEKNYRKVYDKRVIFDDLNTLPYGY
ncbi:hypothetical protein AVEN_260642-1 [Araneus ventricosus]|uniref:DNA-directed DNA polymerase n=1 Tax=Araneus ventricosus TaxID=182803 RepID=A0A4Y2PVB8_ARAVE|nr:hypothetical protein AVEN_260642-1 [Araneus ventricosus]